MSAAQAQQAKQLLATVEEIELDLLDASPFNPRKTFDEDALKDLAASITSIGITQPLLVRVRDPEGLDGRYEIVAGHRRFAAAAIAKRATVPCITLILTDAEAADLALIDNLQRADVPALEEAEAFDELLVRYGSASAVAAKVGKDVAYVTRRLQLMALGKMPRKALAERLIAVDHALLLARLGADEQDVNLKWALNTNAGVKEAVETTIAQRIQERDRKGSSYRSYWEPQSPLDLKNHIEQHVGRKLSLAPWDLTDGQLTAAGPCEGCPSNTKANAALFSDLAIDDATCENGCCFESKRAAFVNIQLGTVKDGVKLSWKISSAAPRMAKDGDGPNIAHVLRYGQWIDAKKGSCPHVRAGVTVDWDGFDGHSVLAKKKRQPGEALMVCIASGCKTHPKGWEKSKQGGSGQRRDPAAEKAEDEKRAADAIVENKLRMGVASFALDGVKALPAEAIRALALAVAPYHGIDVKTSEALLPGFRKILETSPVNSAQFAKALALVSLDSLCVNEYQGPQSGRDRFLVSAKRIGFKGATPWDMPKADAKKPGPKKTLKPAARKAAKKAARK